MAKTLFPFELAHARLCESSGSEHSSDDLSVLVDSFMERDSLYEQQQEEDNKRSKQDHGLETKETLRSLLLCGSNNVVKMIRQETELIITSSQEGFTRRLVVLRLRERGFDAGLCKSRWGKSDYEYIDVKFNGERFIVEVFLAGEFTIARPTRHYQSLLSVLPQVFVGRGEELKQVVKIMCVGMRESMKKNEMHVPPWRRKGYMQAKWFGSYRRTTGAG